jgi:hypothetical protein
MGRFCRRRLQFEVVGLLLGRPLVLFQGFEGRRWLTFEIETETETETEIEIEIGTGIGTVTGIVAAGGG